MCSLLFWSCSILLVYMVSASISDPKLVGSGEMWLWPKGITFDGYKRVFENSNIWIGYWNTILYTVSARRSTWR